MKVKTSTQRLVNLSVSILLAFAVLAAALPAPAAAAPLVVCEDTHVVKAGESVRRIAKEYGVTVYRLARANDLDRPYSVTVGQELCIPEVPKQSSNYKWSATFNGSRVEVSGSKFKKNHPFIVKVREDDTSAWYKLGKTAADKNGELEDDFSVPKDLRKAVSLRVCLKDGVTDFLDCKLVWRR